MTHTYTYTDRLEEIWDIQRDQQQRLNLDPRALAPMARAGVMKDFALGMYEELKVLVDATTNYKAHVLRSPKVERTNVADQAASLMKYLVAVCQLHNVTPADLFDAYKRKTAVVDDRARGNRIELERSTKLIITDLDGCVADLSAWQDQLRAQQGTAPNNDKTVQMLESLKEDFYRGGGFLELPPVQGAAEALGEMRAAGYTIAIVTARPQWQYKRLHSDTIEWLRKNNVPYDLILFNKDKAEAIYEHIYPARPLFFVEDRAKHVLELVNIGVRVMHLGGGNDLSAHNLILPVKGWEEIVQEFRRLAA